MAAPQEGRIYLVSLGFSQHHGSELSVGWQWYCRLSARSPVTIITHALFKDERFIETDLQARCIFLGRADESEIRFNRWHIFFAYSFWAAALQFLKGTLSPRDRVFIATPAALWFLPFLGRMSGRRLQFYYGPLGGELLEARLLRDIGERARAHLRNMITAVMIFSWRTCSGYLPQRVSFRTENTRKIFPPADFLGMGVLPEVEILDQSGAVQPTRCQSPDSSKLLLVSLDGRLRKNTRANLAVAATLSRLIEPRIVILGSDGLVKRYRKHLPNGANLELREQMPRSKFLSFLAEEQPSIIALSLSEGVPGYLLEALSAGCWALVYPVGGIFWLLDCAAEVIPANEVAGLELPGAAFWLRWDTTSRQLYQTKARSSFGAITEELES